MKKLSVIILVFILILGCVSCKSKEESTGNVSLIVDGTDEPDTVSDVPDESGFISEEDDIILLTEPPVLIVESGGKSCDALWGTYSWEYPNGDGTNTGIEADSLHPLECEDLLHLLETAEPTAYYSFYIKIIKNSDELYDLGQPYAKYAEVLEQIMIDRSDTNGRVYEDINNGENFDNNCFAISDIDGDGREDDFGGK